MISASQIQAFSVIVPVLNQEKNILRTLQSVEDSIRYFFEQQAKLPDAVPVKAEVLVVNEGSSDRTLEIVREFAQDKPHLQIINHFKALGIGPARNTGARMAQGDILFFCDGDDLYYPSHLYAAYRVLNQQPGETSFELEGQVIPLPPQPVGVVRTGVHMQDTLHPHWKGAIENTIAQNLCVRRLVHEFVEGYPEAPVYKEIGCEDISYDLWIYKFFKTFKIDVETVEYIRYPGNNLDRQLKKFQTAPEQWQDDTPPEKKELHRIRQKVEQDRAAYLLEKFRKTERTPELMGLLNWLELGGEYLKAQGYPEAIALYEYGLAQNPNQSAVRTQLAVAYNNLGSAYHQQKVLPEAMEYFQRAIAIQPTFGNTDLARLHYNVATTLRDQSQFQAAMDALNQAIALDPNLSEAQNLVGTLSYKAHVEQRGYEFNEDWFSHNIPHWTECLSRFIGQETLNVLEVGSWEGRSTVWLLDNILTASTAHITCLDTFAGGVDNKAVHDDAHLQTIEQRFDFNMARSGVPQKVTKLVGQSSDSLRSLKRETFDFAYIDGSHIAADVLEDTLMSWSLVKVGGVIIFDDYGFRFAEGIHEDPPRVAIDAFLSVYGRKVKILHQAYQLVVEKLVA